jgi:hypothetical protein
MVQHWSNISQISRQRADVALACKKVPAFFAVRETNGLGERDRLHGVTLFIVASVKATLVEKFGAVAPVANDASIAV